VDASDAEELGECVYKERQVCLWDRSGEVDCGVSDAEVDKVVAFKCGRDDPIEGGERERWRDGCNLSLNCAREEGYQDYGET